MQQAIVISSHYDATSGYPNLASWTPSAELLAARVAQYGYPIERLLPGPGLVHRLRDVLRHSNPHVSAILYFAGYALVTENGDPALLMADEHVTALRLTQLTNRVSAAFGRVLLILDTTLGSAASDVEDTRAALGAPRLETPEATMAELMTATCEASNVSMLVGVRPWGASGRSASAFASLIEVGLKELSNAYAPTKATELYDWLHERDESPGLAIGFVPAEPDFVVLPRRQFPSNPAALSPSPMVRMGVVPPLPPPPLTPPPTVAAPPFAASHGAELNHSPTLLPDNSGYPVPNAEAQPGSSTTANGPPSSNVEPRQSVPPPLPFERTSQPGVAVEAAPPPDRVSTPAMPTPPPVPVERASQPVAPPPPLPVERSSQPAGVSPPPPLERASGVAVAAAAVVDPSPRTVAPVSTQPSLEGAVALFEHFTPASESASNSQTEDVGPPPGQSPSFAFPNEEQLEVSSTAMDPTAASGETETAGPVDEAPTSGVEPAIPTEHRFVHDRTPPPEDEPPRDVYATSPGSPEGSGFDDDWEQERPSEAPTASGELPIGAPPEITPPPSSQSQPTEPKPPGTAHDSPAAPIAFPPPPVADPTMSENSVAAQPSPEPPVVAAEAQPIPSRPPKAPPLFAGPESWQPPRPPPPPSEAVDEAALVARAQAALANDDAREALDTARRCLSLFPNSVAALQVAATLLARLEQWEELATLYEQLISGHPDPQAVSKLCLAASRLYMSKLNSPQRASRALERACELQPRRSELQLEAAAFYETLDRVDDAEIHYKSALRVDPLNIRCYRRAAAFFFWIREKDLAWNAASIVAFLGPAEEPEQEILALNVSDGLPRPASALAPGHYSSGLSAAASDPQLGSLFTFIGDVARRIDLPKQRQQQQILRELSAEAPASSTTTLARAFSWVCQLLSIPVPELYLAESGELPSLLPTDQAAWRVGKGVGRGLSARELLFIWARALSRLQPEARSSLHFADHDGLLDLIAATLFATGRIGKPNERAHRLGKSLKRQLDPGSLHALNERLEGFDPTTAPARIAAWQQQLDLISNRVGLLACADPQIAARTLQRFPAGRIPLQDQLADLFSFAMSNSYLELRRQLGLALD